MQSYHGIDLRLISPKVLQETKSNAWLSLGGASQKKRMMASQIDDRLLGEGDVEGNKVS